MKRIILLIILSLMIFSACNNYKLKGNVIPYKYEEELECHYFGNGLSFNDRQSFIYKDSILKISKTIWEDSIVIYKHKLFDVIYEDNVHYPKGKLDTISFKNIVWNDLGYIIDNYDGNNGNDTIIDRLFYDNITRKIVLGIYAINKEFTAMYRLDTLYFKTIDEILKAPKEELAKDNIKKIIIIK